MVAAMIDLVLEGAGKNALGTAVMRELLCGLAAAGGAPVLLRGAGDVFSAGLNLVEIAGLDDEGMRAYLGVLEDLIRGLYLYPGPLVVHVHGHAIAGRPTFGDWLAGVSNGCLMALSANTPAGRR